MSKFQKLACFIMLVCFPCLFGFSPAGCGGTIEPESSNQLSREEQYSNPNTGSIAFTLDWSNPHGQIEPENTITDEATLSEKDTDKSQETGSITIHWN